MPRVLGRVRLSRVTDATTSPERQQELITKWSEGNGHEVVGWAVDLDVSRSVNPLEAPELSQWLAEDRAGSWDILACWKLDRVATGSIYLNKIMSWCFDHDKTLTSVTENFDLTSWVGRMVANVIAGVAEGELEMISERNASAARHNIAAGKYRGGLTPAGYRAEKINGDWRLVPDEEGLAPVIREIVAKVLAGGPGSRLSAIIADLNRRGVQTHKDRQAVLNDKEPKGRKWTNSNLRRLLSSPTLAGRAVTRERTRVNGKTTYGPEQPVLGDDGIPLQRTEPLISVADYRALQNLLAERREAEPAQRRSAETTLLLRVIHCSCGLPMYRLKGGPGRKPRYRCSAVQHGDPCGNGSVPIEDADKGVTKVLLDLLGEIPHADKVLDPGTDNTAELAELDAQLDALAEAVPRFKAGSSALANILAQADALNARKTILEAEPRREAAYRYVPTGVTFAQHWAGLDPASRNDFLRDHGVKLVYTSAPRPGQSRFDLTFGDFPAMVEAIDPELAERVRERMSRPFNEYELTDREEAAAAEFYGW